MDPLVQFALAKNGPALQKVGGVFPAAVACPSMVKTDEDAAVEHLHLVDEVSIRESVDSLCRDDADMPMPPYIRKACNRPNAAFVSLFR